MSDALTEKPLSELTSHEVGVIGERLATTFLESKDYSILEKNWACKFGEADIIARDGSEIAFIEVKTRVQNEDKSVTPEIAVTPKKIDTYRKLMKAYVAIHPTAEEMRFDVIGIVLDSDRIAHVHYIKGISLGDDDE